MKLHTKIIIGLVSGACAGVVANAFATGAAWVAWTGIPAGWAADKVQWVGNNVAGPVGIPVHATQAAPVAKALATTPAQAPDNSPMMILVWSFTADRGRGGAPGCGAPRTGSR